MEEYEKARKCKGNLNEYIMALTTSADKGYELAIKELENEYINGNITCQNYNVTLIFYENGDGLYSKFAIAEYYHHTKCDYKKALELYLKLTEENFGMAINAVGYIYLKGQGVKQDYKMAVKYFKMSKYGYNNLGYMYQQGFGVKLDLDTAIKYYKLAIADGNVNGIGNLVELYKTYRYDDDEILQYFIQIGHKNELYKIFPNNYLLDMLLKLKKENQEMKNHIFASPDGPLYFEALQSWKRDAKLSDN